MVTNQTPAHSPINRSPHDQPPASRESATPSALHPSVAWEELAAGGRLVVIRFRDQIYQLRETRNGKLILTK